MPVKLKTIQKLHVIQPAARRSAAQLLPPLQLEVSATKTGGPLNSVVEVGSSGPDDSRFTDGQLTPGPATRSIDPSNSYVLVWTAAFVQAGSTTLTARVMTAAGKVIIKKSLSLKGVKGQVSTRVVML